MRGLIAIVWMSCAFGGFAVSASGQSLPRGAYIVVELDRETLRWSRLQEISTHVSTALAARGVRLRDTSGVSGRSYFIDLDRSQDSGRALEIIAAALTEMEERDARV